MKRGKRYQEAMKLVDTKKAYEIGKGLANDEVELIIRDGLIKEKVASSEILGRLKELVWLEFHYFHIFS